MSDMIVEMDNDTLERLLMRAKRNGRDVGDEARIMLEEFFDKPEAQSSKNEL